MILMIHNVRKEFFDLELSGYELTFDDGLYSQYYYLPLFEKIVAPRIYFVATSFVRPGKRRGVFDGRHLPYRKCREYMYEAFVQGKFGGFMTLDELKFLAEEKNATFGAHSHFHDVIPTMDSPKKTVSAWKLARAPAPEGCCSDSPSNRRSKLAFRGYAISGGRFTRRSKKEWEDYVRRDTELCLSWFEKNLGVRPEAYGFPFNEHTPELVEILKGYGFKRFYDGRSGDGAEIRNRIDIDKLSGGSLRPRSRQVKATSPSQ